MIAMADVIDIAINKYLWDGHSDTVRRSTEFYSCAAIASVLKNKDSEIIKIRDCFQAMGMVTGYREGFSSIPYGPKRQYARALWLTWAAMIAREEGLTL